MSIIPRSPAVQAAIDSLPPDIRSWLDNALALRGPGTCDDATVEALLYAVALLHVRVAALEAHTDPPGAALKTRYTPRKP